MSVMDITNHLFRFRQFVAGIEDRKLLEDMRNIVESQIGLLPPVIVQTVKVEVNVSKSENVVASAVAEDIPTKGWVPIANAPIVNPGHTQKIAQKLPKNGLIKYTTYGSGNEGKVATRGSAKLYIHKHTVDDQFTTNKYAIFYTKVTHVWVA